MTESAGYKRLYRSRRDRVIGGVCGGVGGYLNMDPVVIRVIWLATILLGGAGVLGYLIAWILIPEAPSGKDPGPVEREVDGVKILGITLIVISLAWLATRFFGHTFHFIHWGWLGPLALVALGVALLIRPSIQRASSIGPESTMYTSGKEGEPAAETISGDETKQEEPRENPFAARTGMRRSRRDRVLLGVCGGLAQQWNVDATVIRVLWALGTVLGAGVLLIAYLVLALVIPDEEER